MCARVRASVSAGAYGRAAYSRVFPRRVRARTHTHPADVPLVADCVLFRRLCRSILGHRAQHNGADTPWTARAPTTLTTALLRARTHCADVFEVLEAQRLHAQQLQQLRHVARGRGAQHRAKHLRRIHLR